MKYFTRMLGLVVCSILISCVNQSPYRPVTSTVTIDESRFNSKGTIAIAVLEGGNFNLSNAIQIAKASGLDVVTNNKRIPDYLLYIKVVQNHVAIPTYKNVASQTDFIGTANGKLISGTGYQTTTIPTTEDLSLSTISLSLESVHSKDKRPIWFAITTGEWATMYIYTDKILQKAFSHYGKAIDNEDYNPSID